MITFFLRSVAARAAAALWLILLAMAGAGASLAQTPGTTPRLELTVDQAVAMALANNRDIEVARVDLASSEEATRAAMGIYDPVVSLSAFRERRTIPVSSILGGSTTGSLHEGETQVLPSV